MTHPKCCGVSLLLCRVRLRKILSSKEAGLDGCVGTQRDNWRPSRKVPLLDIVGLQAPFRPEADNNVYVWRFVTGVVPVTVNGACHALPDEQAQDVVEKVIDWTKDSSKR